MRVGIAADHGGFGLKQQVAETLRGWEFEVVDFGAHELNTGDDYPDFVIPLCRLSRLARLNADLRFAAAASVRPSSRTKLPACEQR